MNTEERLQDFIDYHDLNFSSIREVAHSDKLYPSHSNRCFEVRLSYREYHENYAWFYVFTGKGIHELEIIEFLRMAVDIAREARDCESWDRFFRENKDDLIATIGEEDAKLYYQHSRDAHTAFLDVLGEDIYKELVDIVEEQQSFHSPTKIAEELKIITERWNKYEN